MSVWISVAVAFGIAVFLFKSITNYLALRSLPVREAAAGGLDVTVIIPARNEERNIARAVESFTSIRTIVVDDASADGTAALARKAGAEVVSAPPLDPGQLGKPNACAAGARLSSSKWLLFADADTWHKPALLPSMIAFAEAKSVDMLSLFLHQHTVGAAERIILPYAFALYFCGVSADNVNSPNSREALANGQCLLVRRSAYEAIGGHAAVANSVIEDVALAALAKSRGLSVRVMRGEHLGSVRMYENFFAIRRGFEKNSFRFLRQNPSTGIQVIAASVLLTSWLPLVVWLALDSHRIAAIAFAFVPPVLLSPWYASVKRAITAPIAIYLFQLIAVSAMFRTLRGIKTEWKGRGV